jgi:hypothetical protein
LWVKAHGATGGRQGDGDALCARMAATIPWVAGVWRFPMRRIVMDEVTFHREPPANIPTMVTALSGWIDAGEAATGAMRFLVRQLAAEPLAAIDLEDFVDFTQVRPVVRLSTEGERIIRWPRSAFWLWQPPEPRTGLLLFRGLGAPAAVAAPTPRRSWTSPRAVACSASCRWARSSRPYPIPGPHASRAAAPTPPGRHI